MSALIKEGSIKSLPVILKGDVDGSIDAISESLMKLNNDEVEIKIIHSAVGMVTESDVLLADASNAVIVAFGVQVSSNAKLQASQAGVDIRTYNVIYNVVDEIKLALEGLLEPDKVENVVGKAIVQQQFKIPNLGFIAGSKVTEGVIKRNMTARLFRDDELFIEGKIESLKRFKDDVKDVKDGLECGIGISGMKKYLEGDVIEVFEIKELKRTLD
jgi:translation initiation factor IF-2